MTRRRGHTRFPAVASLAMLAAIAASILFLDRAVSTFAHDTLHRPSLFVAFTHIADWPVPIAGLVLACAGIVCLAGWRPGTAARDLLMAAIAILVARETADLLKFVFGRPWPETWVDHNPSWIGTATYGFFPLHGGRGFASFPSGHETDIACPAALLWRTTNPLARLVAAIAAALVGAGLIVSDYHFLGDVLAGLWLGTVVAYGVMSLTER